MRLKTTTLTHVQQEHMKQVFTLIKTTDEKYWKQVESSLVLYLYYPFKIYRFVDVVLV